MIKIRSFCIMLIYILIAGCITIPGDELIMKPVYSVVKKEITKIEGNYIIKDLIIYRNGTWDVNREVFTLCYLENFNGEADFYLKALYDGQGWKFIDSFKIKIDENIYTFKDDNPKRITISGSRVKEINLVNISDEMLHKLTGANSVIIEYLSLNKIDEIGIKAIKKFINNNSK